MAKGRLQINIGDPQPIPCDKCGGMHGYQYSDYISIHYDCIYEADGSYYGGVYSDFSRTLNKGVTAYCSNCGFRLKFDIIRD